MRASYSTHRVLYSSILGHCCDGVWSRSGRMARALTAEEPYCRGYAPDLAGACTAFA